jgi:hypothetical protein
MIMLLNHFQHVIWDSATVAPTQRTDSEGVYYNFGGSMRGVTNLQGSLRALAQE